ncbi:MAG: PA2779 family protein [Burkholderiales bacterium]
MRFRFRRVVTGVLVPAVVALSTAGPTRAAMIDTPTASGPPTTDGIPASLAPMVDRDVVRTRLIEAGLPADEAAARAAALTASELASLGRLESQPAGRGIVGIAVFVFAVLFMTDVLGYTKIFPFTRTPR